MRVGKAGHAVDQVRWRRTSRRRRRHVFSTGDARHVFDAFSKRCRQHQSWQSRSVRGSRERLIERQRSTENVNGVA